MQAVKITTFTATSDDTTSYFSIKDAAKLGFIIYSTDSCAVDLYFLGRNSAYNTYTASYADSLVTESNTGAATAVTISGTTLDRLALCDEMAIGYVFRATGQGTTAGRIFRIIKQTKTP